MGYQLAPFNRQQIIPEIVPDPELYAGPEDFSRLFRPWLGADFSRLMTPQVTNNSGLSRQKLYLLLRLCGQTLDLEGDIFEAGVASGGSARLMLDCLLRREVRKTLWLLDTFEGYQKIDPMRDGAHVQINQCRGNSYDDVKHLLANDTVPIRLIKGLIPEHLRRLRPTKSVLHTLTSIFTSQPWRRRSFASDVLCRAESSFLMITAGPRLIVRARRLTKHVEQSDGPSFVSQNPRRRSSFGHRPIPADIDEAD